MGEDQKRFSPRVSIPEYQENLKSIFITRDDIMYVLLLLPTNRAYPQPKQGESYRKAAKKIAEQENVLVVDMDTYQSSASFQERFLDVVHPSPLGHREIASEICSAIKATQK